MGAFVSVGWEADVFTLASRREGDSNQLRPFDRQVLHSFLVPVSVCVCVCVFGRCARRLFNRRTAHEGFLLQVRQ